MILGFDIGRSKTRLAVFESDQKELESVIFDTPADPQGGELLKQIEEILAGQSVTEIIGGKSRVIWPDFDLKSFFEKNYQVEVVVENDSAMVGLGEAVYGAGRDYDILVYITVSTGVGGARIIKGQIDESYLGFEPGYQILTVENELKHLEDLISGSALEAKTGQKPYQIHDPATWDLHAKYLALGLVNSIVHWSPEAVIVGGSMMKVPGIDLDQVRKYLEEYLTIYPQNPALKLASLGDIGGLYGALAFSQIKAKN